MFFRTWVAEIDLNTKKKLTFYEKMVKKWKRRSPDPILLRGQSFINPILIQKIFLFTHFYRAIT